MYGNTLGCKMIRYGLCCLFVTTAGSLFLFLLTLFYHKVFKPGEDAAISVDVASVGDGMSDSEKNLFFFQS